MTVEDILKTHPRRLIADLAVLVDCVDECADCAGVCIVCADACLAEDDVRALIRCIRLCLDCADACIDTGRIVSRQTDPHLDTQRTALEACLVACRAAAAECERHAPITSIADCALRSAGAARWPATPCSPRSAPPDQDQPRRASSRPSIALRSHRSRAS